MSIGPFMQHIIPPEEAVQGFLGALFQPNGQVVSNISFLGMAGAVLKIREKL
jgi:hypothetical protein